MTQGKCSDHAWINIDIACDLQCLVLSVGRKTDELIITEEPDVSDAFVQDLLTAVMHPKSLSHLHHSTDLKLPFELRTLEVALATATQLLSLEVTGVVQAARKRLRQLTVSEVWPGGLTCAVPPVCRDSTARAVLNPQRCGDSSLLNLHIVGVCLLCQTDCPEACSSKEAFGKTSSAQPRPATLRTGTR